MRCAAIDKAAAFPVADQRLGERVCLAIVLRSGAALELESLLRQLDAAGLSRYERPEFVLPLDEMPLTASGKIVKRELVRWVADGCATPQPLRQTESG